MKKILLTALTLSLCTLNTQAETLKDFITKEETNKTIADKEAHKHIVKPYYQGDVVTVEHGGGYTYIEVKEKTEKTFWIAVNNSEAKVGDFVRFQKELVSKDFKSKALKRTFKELMFASNLEYRVSK